MRKANTEHLDMHCQVLAEPHSSTHTNMPGKSRAECRQSPLQHVPRKSCPGKGKGVPGVRPGYWTAASFSALQKTSAVGTGARSVMSLEFLTHLSQVSLQGIRMQNTFRMKNAVKSCLLYGFVKPGRQVEYNTTNLCAFLFAVFRTPQSSFPEHKAFCLHFNHLDSGGITNKDGRGHASPMQESPLHFSTKCHAFS